jgi:hypothetical protein
MRAIAIVWFLSSTAAHAGPPSLALPEGKMQVALTVELESAADRLGDPITIAPDLAYGVTRDLTLSVVHSKFGVTGFRAVTGGGLCVAGDCAHVYNNAGVEALYALRDGRASVAAIGGIHAMDLDGGLYDAKLGVRARFTAGRFAVLASPSVLVALTERTDAMGVRRNRDLYYAPVLATYRIAPRLTAGLGTGVKGAFEDAANAWEVPLGAVASCAIDPRVTVGASFVFGKLVGGAAATGTDFRGTQMWITVTP